MARDNTIQRMNEPRERTMATSIVLMGTMAGPQGIARRGTVLNSPRHITEETAKQLLETKQARPFADEDRKRPVGFVVAKTEE